MKQIDIPNKFDIIPIHSSDRATFKTCRRRWNWSSPSKQNLTARADVVGVAPELWFGTGIHWALEQYYNPLFQRDPVDAFATWFDIQWRGGLVTEDWLDKVYDLKPHKITNRDVVLGVDKPGLDRYGKEHPNDYPSSDPFWRVKGLQDILPDPDPEEWLGYLDLGINMMKHYKNYAEVNDDFRITAVEHTFSIPVWDYVNDKILKAIDLREDSPNYGKALEVHARGRVDAQWEKPNGRTGIIDHKTSSKWGEDDKELEKLESDEQCTNYLYAREIEIKYYGLDTAPPEEIIYNVLRKAYPKQPTELKNGMFSVDRQNESTTYDLLQKWIASHIPGVALSQSQQSYVNYLRDVGDEQFIIRRSVRRNRHQIANAGFRLYQESLDMLNPDIQIYPNIRDSWDCLRCRFRAPCMAMESGADWKWIINEQFTSNRDR